MLDAATLFRGQDASDHIKWFNCYAEEKLVSSCDEGFVCRVWADFYFANGPGRREYVGIGLSRIEAIVDARSALINGAVEQYEYEISMVDPEVVAAVRRSAKELQRTLVPRPAYVRYRESLSSE